MKDLHSGLKVVSLIDAVTAAADTTPVAVDRQGYEAVEIVLSIGIGGITFSSSNKIEFVLTHSDDNSTYTNVADADMLGVSGISSGIIKSLIAAHAAGSVHRFGYKGGKRYLKLLADFSGTHGTGTPIGANVLLGRGYNRPEANQA
jgi:hypothetical protein